MCRNNRTKDSRLEDQPEKMNWGPQMGLWKERKKSRLIGNIKESLNYVNLWKLGNQC